MTRKVRETLETIRMGFTDFDTYKAYHKEVKKHHYILVECLSGCVNVFRIFLVDAQSNVQPVIIF